MMEAGEFIGPGTTKDSKNSTGAMMHAGPNITNIGFDVSQQPNIIAYPNAARAQLQTQG